MQQAHLPGLLSSPCPGGALRGLLGWQWALWVSGCLSGGEGFILTLHVKVDFTHLCLPLCDPMHCSHQVLSVHGILQARILEWVARPSSKGSS